MAESSPPRKPGARHAAPRREADAAASSAGSRSAAGGSRLSRGWVTSAPVVITAIVVVALVALVGTRLRSFENGKSQQNASTSTKLAVSPSAAARPTPKPTAVPTPTPAPTPNLQALTQAAKLNAGQSVKAVMAKHPGIDVSVAALNLSTGASFRYGSTSGMVEGSIVKLDILLSGLADEDGLSSYQRSNAVPMIENSDNGAADSLFRSIGGNATMNAANKRFGLTSTDLDGSGQWGLSTTSAADQILLLKQLTGASSVLSAKEKSYALGLMSDVEKDQRWGVGAAADKGSSFVNKNGWLNVDNDGGLWLTNSNGIITVDGQKVLLSVLTQHNRSFGAGVSLVEALAKASAPGVIAAG
ncbi:beta-lactamase class A [Jatrophihabitans sp. GAS493]|uniref:serine hydrolase n=1 Tax=Jatrophihabitans sp. GAS493 TaxID=1907575 RepID=UPI000BBF8062|nr:serine hydrolase [Jatrophihabitans sp. GAS493]SOD75176.1 beta-lactamase class A [Jatrophihabitans sp. GAS493]